jgi:crotonobetainyl-CoA:carnitine CoA-transferase CaiB-like acyl-CoA transferase
MCTGISQFAGHLLAGFGAEVVAVEPPGGVDTRHIGPFVDDVSNPNASLTHWAYNRGKRSVIIDIETVGGRDQLRKLLRTADVLFDDAYPGRLDAVGLGRDDLAALNPQLVHASITPYGSTGPRSRWKGSDLTAVAGSGFLHASGDADRPPVRVGSPMSMLHAAGDAAGAALIALRERGHSGVGQHIDASAQESVTIGQVNNLTTRVNGLRTDRVAGGVITGGLELPLLFPCKDGHTMCVMLMGAAFGRFSSRMIDWEIEEGFGSDALKAVNWDTLGLQLSSGEVSADILIEANATHRAFLATKSKDELWQAAFDRNLLLTPSSTIADLVDNEHLAARDFWNDLPAGNGRAARFPGPLARFSNDQPPAHGAVPTLGQHTDEVDLERRPVVSSAVRAQSDRLPLAGLKVVEFSWVIATPSAVRVLADYGATVVKVENAERLDTMRTVNPFNNEEPHPDNSVGYGVYNAGKQSLALDLSKPGALDVVLDLARWADVLTESFSPGAMARMGYGYEVLKAANPELIVLSSSLLGQTGPASSLAGYGFMAAALAGIYDITGWPDRDPAGPYGPYTDFLAPKVVLTSLLAALENRDRTGEGQHIDLSQTEAAVHYLAPAILDQSVNGRTLQRQGNDDPQMSPHGVFASTGNDQWVAIACYDESWPALAGLIGCTHLEAADQTARRERRDEIEDAISAWTSTRDNNDAATTLQEAGIDAYAVHDADGVTHDPQLAHRSHHVEVPQTYAGTMWTHACRTKMSRTPAQLHRGGPIRGEDTFDVLTEYLGYDADRIADLAAAELLE